MELQMSAGHVPSPGRPSPQGHEDAVRLDGRSQSVLSRSTAAAAAAASTLSSVFLPRYWHEGITRWARKRAYDRAPPNSKPEANPRCSSSLKRCPLSSFFYVHFRAPAFTATRRRPRRRRPPCLAFLDTLKTACNKPSYHAVARSRSLKVDVFTTTLLTGTAAASPFLAFSARLHLRSVLPRSSPLGPTSPLSRTYLPTQPGPGSSDPLSVVPCRTREARCFLCAFTRVLHGKGRPAGNVSQADSEFHKTL
jgi:hypothetical protein